jgi:UDPglucose 6-dehydrogenase
VVVTKSTVPVGTGDEIERIIARPDAESPWGPTGVPARGAAIDDFKRRIRWWWDRRRRAQQVMRELYHRCGLNETPSCSRAGAPAS